MSYKQRIKCIKYVNENANSEVFFNCNGTVIKNAKIAKEHNENVNKMICNFF